MNIGKEIKERRALLGISQQDLSDYSGVGISTVKDLASEMEFQTRHQDEADYKNSDAHYRNSDHQNLLISIRI